MCEILTENDVKAFLNNELHIYINRVWYYTLGMTELVEYSYLKESYLRGILDLCYNCKANHSLIAILLRWTLPWYMSLGLRSLGEIRVIRE